MNNVTYYDPATGLIIGWHTTGALDALDAAYSNYERIDGLYDGREYRIDLESLTAVPRPALSVSADKASITADGADVLTVTGVPAGAKVTVWGPAPAEFTTNGGPLELTAGAEGLYRIRVDLWPYRTWEHQFHAH